MSRYMEKHRKKRTGRQINRRIIAILLAVCALASIFCITGTVFAKDDPSCNVLLSVDGESTDRLLFNMSEKKEIKAECALAAEGSAYQWQICADVENDLWVDISGANKSNLTVSYALLSSMLDNSGSAYIRCMVKLDEDAYYSEATAVTVAYESGINTEFKNGADDFIPKQNARRTAKANNTPQTIADDEYVTVTIRYIDYSSNKEIYSPFTARVAANTSFHQNVISPTFLGYAAYTLTYDDDGNPIFTPASTYDLDFTNLTENVTIDIYYRAIDVNYGIRYFFQNINNDLYTESTDRYYVGKAETGSIISDEEIMQHAGDTEGFSKLYHYPESVAADGSTVFQCYYDRNYYLLKFDMDGGYGVDPIYARYGTPYVVNSPVRHGYVFEGWDHLTEDTDNDGIPDKGDGITDELPSVIGIGNQFYKAIWQTVDTHFTVVYWLENADDENGDSDGNGYSYWASVQLPSLSNEVIKGSDYSDLSRVTVDKYEKAYSQLDHYDESVTVSGDGSTVLNVYYNRKEYTLDFYYAMSTGSTYYVVGGTSYYFGTYNTNGTTGHNRIDYYMQNFINDRNVVGTIEALPTLKDEYNDGRYTVSSKSSTVNGTEYNYHYISFTAKYGADITNLWPCNVLNSVTRTSGGYHGNWNSMSASASAWNGEYNVYYTQAHADNQTIKGKYTRLDYTLLWDIWNHSYSDSETVSYLCFWENGADAGWSVPKLRRYNLYEDCGDGVYEIIDSYDTVDDSGESGQQAPSIIGFTKENTPQGCTAYEATENPDTTLYQDAYNVNFYYTRNQYNLSFQNYGVDLGSYTVPYDYDIADKYFVPDYPASLEPNAYIFDGWYTTPGCYGGSEFSFENAKMPLKNLQLYAKWTPVKHTVRFFTNNKIMEQYELTPDESKIFIKRDVAHGSVVGNVQTPTDPTGSGYSFAGWFYIASNGSKNVFSELDTPINRDINVFADWSSKNVQPYLIHYALEEIEQDMTWLRLLNIESQGSPVENRKYTVTDGDAEKTYIYINGSYHLAAANDTTGYAYEGTTRTFQAKVGKPYNQLYEPYNAGYFPTIASHSITIVPEQKGTAYPEHNVFTFFYVMPQVPIKYTVRFLELETNKELSPTVTHEAYESLITERFTPIANYIPDAFYKRLVLSVRYDEKSQKWVGSDDDNVMTFYYTQNNTAEFYAVHYMLQKPGTDGSDRKIDGTGDYDEDDSIIEGIADIGKTIALTPLNFDGFQIQDTAVIRSDNTEQTISASDGKYNITISANGTELYIFYSRVSYPVKVQYLKYNTTESIFPDKPFVEETILEFGTTFSHTAPRIVGGYALVNPDNMTKSTVVRSDESQNIITFYYSELQYTIEYKFAGDIGGTLSHTLEVENSSDTIIGSTAEPQSGYVFTGWYFDEEGLNPVFDTHEITDNGKTITPNVDFLEPAPAVNVFYAKFEVMREDLTITRENADDEGNGEQVFVYRIMDTTDNSKVYYATITGNGSVTVRYLPCVTYQIDQVGEWSWRYGDDTKVVDLNNSQEVVFNDSAVKDKWLNGNSTVVKNKRVTDHE